MKKVSSIWMCLAASIMLVACGTSRPGPGVQPTLVVADTPVPPATEAATATAFPSPTSTPQPSSTPTATSLPTITPLPTATALPTGWLFFDDFGSMQASTAKGWIFGAAGSVNRAWASNRLILSIQDKELVGWNTIRGDYGDFGAETEMQATSKYAEYGIIFRKSGDTQSGRSFYLFGVTTDGRYYLAKSVNDQWAANAPVSMRTSSYVKQGQEKNVLSVLAQGAKISLYINNVLVRTITDSAVASGEIGIFADSGSSSQAEVVASRFTVFTTEKAASEWSPRPVASTSAPVATKPPVTVAPSTPPLADTIQATLKHVQSLGGAQDRLYGGGGSEACAPLLYDYYSLVEAPTYDVSQQPSNVQNAYGLYRQAVSLVVDKFGVFRSICEGGGGTIGALDFNVARTTVNRAGDLLNQALQALGK
jgi:hypothetical protein